MFVEHFTEGVLGDAADVGIVSLSQVSKNGLVVSTNHFLDFLLDLIHGHNLVDW